MEMPTDNPMSDTEAVISRLIDLLDRSHGVQGVYIDESECKVTADHLRALLALAKRPGEPSEEMIEAAFIEGHRRGRAEGPIYYSAQEDWEQSQTRKAMQNAALSERNADHG
jgi:hypothetical protein